MKTKLIKIAMVVSVVMNMVMMGVFAYITVLDHKIESSMNQPNVVYVNQSKVASITQPAAGDAMMAAVVK